MERSRRDDPPCPAVWVGQALRNCWPIRVMRLGSGAAPQNAGVRCDYSAAETVSKTPPYRDSTSTTVRPLERIR